MSGATRAPVVMTGPTGWIGRALLARLAHHYGEGWPDLVRLFGSRAAELATPDGSLLPVRPLEAITGADVEGALVIHLAYLTKEKAGQLGERRFTDTNLAIDDQLLGALASGRPRALFVASSGAAALAASGRDRHPYGLSKLRQEDRFLAWGARAGVPVLAGRIWNIAGPYMNKVGAYALGDMLTQAHATGTIRINAAMPVFRSYLHVSDLADLVLLMLLAGVDRPEAVDLCGGEALELSDIAERVAGLLRLDPTTAITRPPVDVSCPNVYLGDFSQIKALAMQVGLRLIGFDRQLVDTASDLLP